MSKDLLSYEITAEVIFNTEWKVKYDIGYGAAMYIGTGPEAKFIMKASDKEIGLTVLMEVYQRIAEDHKHLVATGKRYRSKKLPWYRKLKLWWILKFAPEKKYDYPADIDKEFPMQ